MNMRFLANTVFITVASISLLACNKSEDKPVKEEVKADQPTQSNTDTLPKPTKYQEGKHYVVLKKPISPDMLPDNEASDMQNTVLEFFWYGCPHCQHIEGPMEKWKSTMPSSVKLVRVPAIWSEPMALHARMYYLHNKSPKTEELHKEIFNAVIPNKSQSAGQQIQLYTPIFEQYGIGAMAFESGLHAPNLDEKLEKAHQLMGAAEVRGTPALVVHGKYSVVTNSVGSQEDIFKIVNFLLRKMK